jgi:predicted RNase H-like HicB family nuclease
MSDYPIMFTVRDAITGNGFLAGVTMGGRAIARKEEDDKWWVHGVRPAGISAVGNTPEEAFMRFRETYKNVLFDIAEDCKNYDDFKNEVDSLYTQTNEIEENNWDTAFRAIRAGTVKAEGFFSELPKQAPEKRPTH